MNKLKSSKNKNNKEILVSDYILDFLIKKGVKHVFILQGGAIAFLIDAFSRRKDISYIAVAHEQSAAMMADAYSRIGPNFGATMSTSGPGATNLITGICCSWFDSIPVLHISGQVNTYEQRDFHASLKNVRQVGFQETDIVSITNTITKFSKKISDKKLIKFYFEKSYNISQDKRQGPVLIDLPMDFQRQDLTKINSINFKKNVKRSRDKFLNNKLELIIKSIKKSLRPLLIIGGGVRLSKSVKELNLLINKLKLPVVTTWAGMDCIDAKNKYLIGTIGVYGTRSANLTVQNSDLIISIGTRLDTRVTGGKPETFAPNAKKILIDIDKNELLKRRGLTPDVSIAIDALLLVKKLLIKLNKHSLQYDCNEWIKTCHFFKKKYPIVLKKYRNEKKHVNPYLFFDKLSKHLNRKDIIVADTGAHLTWCMQTFQLKLGQRVISAFGHSPMGYAFPASIGASLAENSKRVISVNGDGSFQINIQELQTLKSLNLPIKVFIFNNKGYGIIKQFQTSYLEKRFEATSKTGYSSPNFKKISKGYDIKYFSINSNATIDNKLKSILTFQGPCLCEIKINSNQQIIPKLEFGRPIHDLSPLLSRKELKSNIMS